MLTWRTPQWQVSSAAYSIHLRHGLRHFYTLPFCVGTNTMSRQHKSEKVWICPLWLWIYLSTVIQHDTQNAVWSCTWFSSDTEACGQTNAGVGRLWVPKAVDSLREDCIFIESFKLEVDHLECICLFPIFYSKRVIIFSPFSPIGKSSHLPTLRLLIIYLPSITEGHSQIPTCPQLLGF